MLQMHVPVKKLKALAATVNIHGVKNVAAKEKLKDYPLYRIYNLVKAATEILPQPQYRDKLYKQQIIFFHAPRL